MFRLRFLPIVAIISCVAAVLGCNRVPALTPADMKSDENSIWSVVQRKEVVFAATNNGLYRASMSDKIWYKLPTPSSLPSWGHFARESSTSSPLVYFTGAGEMGMMKEPNTLFVSKDLGLSWTLTSTQYNLLDAFVHPDGSLYAVAYIKTTTPPSKKNPSYSESTSSADGQTYYPERRVLVSHNLGKSWSDISEGLPTQYENFVVQDPDHPELISVVSSRPMHAFSVDVYQADDQHYHWRKTEKHPNELPGNRENIFGSLSPGSNNTNDVATLSSFFKLPYLKWGNSLGVQAGQIVTEKPAYAFRQHEPMPVMLTIKFVFSRPPLKFYDNKDETVCWNLRGFPEQGKNFYSKCKATDLYINSPDHEAKMKQYADDLNRVIVDLDEAHPYTRTIDLSKLYDFPAPGKYRIQLVKALCSFFKEDASFAGQVIEVTITE